MSEWKDFVTSALIGTEKGAPAVLPEGLNSVLVQAAPETSFLTRAGALSLWRKAGWKPGASGPPPAAAAPEESRPIRGACKEHLRTMLGGRFSGVLPEWLNAAARLGRRIPPELLPPLLDRARQDRSLRAPALAAGGRRAEWLAAHNPDWVFAAREEPGMWEEGNRDQRIAALRAIRATNPCEARRKIEAVWNAEPADTRAVFITELMANLGSEDTAFLDSTLDDKSKEVRKAAVDLLARLPDSAFVNRMTGRATELLTFKAGGLLSRASLEIRLPDEPNPAAKRDGLDPKAFGQQKKLGEKAVLLLLILSAVPLRRWTDSFRQTPATLLKAAEKNEFADAIITGWAWAAIRQKDTAWAEAVLEGDRRPLDEFLPGNQLLGTLPEETRAKRLAGIIRATGLKKDDAEAWRALASQLDAFEGHWPTPLAREVLAALRQTAADGIPWHLRANADNFVLRFPPSLLPEALNGWATDKEGVAALAELAAFRHESLTALNQN